MTTELEQLRSDYYCATEIALATLEGCQRRKGTSKSELRRHLAISQDMVNVCSSHARKQLPLRCPRLLERLATRNEIESK